MIALDWHRGILSREETRIRNSECHPTTLHRFTPRYHETEGFRKTRHRDEASPARPTPFTSRRPPREHPNTRRIRVRAEHHNKPDDNTPTWIDYSGNLPTGGGYEMTQLYDMNTDGFCDVVAGGDGRVTLWTGDGAGNWTPAANYIIENDPDCSFEAFRVGGDADHNGYPDIVHLTDEGGWINSYNHLRFYEETSTPVSLSITPIFPRGG